MTDLLILLPLLDLDWWLSRLSSKTTLVNNLQRGWLLLHGHLLISGLLGLSRLCWGIFRRLYNLFLIIDNLCLRLLNNILILLLPLLFWLDICRVIYIILILVLFILLFMFLIYLQSALLFLI